MKTENRLKKNESNNQKCIATSQRAHEYNFIGYVTHDKMAKISLKSPIKTKYNLKI